MSCALEAHVTAVSAPVTVSCTAAPFGRLKSVLFIVRPDGSSVSCGYVTVTVRVRPSSETTTSFVISVFSLPVAIFSFTALINSAVFGNANPSAAVNTVVATYVLFSSNSASSPNSVSSSSLHVVDVTSYGFGIRDAVGVTSFKSSLMSVPPVLPAYSVNTKSSAISSAAVDRL